MSNTATMAMFSIVTLTAMIMPTDDISTVLAAAARSTPVPLAAAKGAAVKRKVCVKNTLF